MSNHPGQAAREDMLARLAGKRPQSATYTVVLDGDLLDAAADAKSALDRLELFQRDDAEIAEARAAAQAAAEAADGASLTLHLHGLPRDVYEALQLRYPPTAEQKEKEQEYDVNALMPALIAATVVADPAVTSRVTVKDLDAFDTTPLPGRLFTAADVHELIGDWNLAETTALWNAAITVCSRVRNPALPFASRQTRG